MTSERRQIYWISIVGGLAILAAGGLLIHALERYQVNQASTLPGQPLSFSRPHSPPNPAQVNYHVNASLPFFKQIADQDRAYRLASARWVAFRFKGVKVQGADAGAISLVAIHLASGIVPLPKSLGSAHVVLPPTDPPNNSVSGITGTVVNRIQRQAASHHMQLTVRQSESLLMTTAEAGLALQSNNPLRFVTYLDGLIKVPGTGRSLAQSAVAPNGPLLARMVSKSQGDLPNAVYYYRQWAYVTPVPTLHWISPGATADHHLVAEVTLTNPVKVRGIATTSRGAAIADIVAKPFRTVTLGLLKSRGVTRWYILSYRLGAGSPQITRVLVNNLNANGY